MKHIKKYEKFSSSKYNFGDIVKNISGKFGVVKMVIPIKAGLTYDIGINTILYSYFVNFFGNSGIGEPYHVDDLTTPTQEEIDLYKNTKKYNL